MTGKFDPSALSEYVFSRTGAGNDGLLVGPGYAEDAAAVETEGGTLVVSTDPISLAAERIGTLAVDVASNDVAASGGDPTWLVSTVFLPARDEALLDEITDQLDAEADRLGISIVGGHTESVAALDRPLLSLTCFGPADRYVPTSGASPGDAVLLTKGAGVEATAVLATDFRDAIDRPADVLDRAAAFFEDLSVVPEAAALSPFASAMHDPTEGGILAGLVELARASEVRLAVEEDAVPVREETRALCDAMGVDPLRVLGSGALLATVPADALDDAQAALERAGVDAAVVGRVEEGTPGVALDGEVYADAVADEMWALWD